MISIEKIANGYISIFKNTDNVEIKLYFPNYDELSKWIKTQFEGK